MSIVRLLLSGGVLFVVGWMAARYSFNSRQAVSDVGSLVGATLVLAALPMAFRRYRSLQAFSWLWLFSTGLMVYGESGELIRPKPEREVEEWQMTEQSSRDGLVTLQVPSTWKESKALRHTDVDLALASMRDNFAIVESHEPVSKFPPQSDLSAYVAAARKVYATRHSGSFGKTEMVSVAGFPAYKMPVDCKMGDVQARGFLFVVRSEAHFHIFTVLTEPEYAQHLDAPVRWIQESRVRSP
jgi:hypothetical protein